MGITISITLPEPIEKHYREKANKKDISRSKIIRDSLVDLYEKEIAIEKKKYGNAPNKCKNRKRNGYCADFDRICEASQNHAETCLLYNK